MCIKTKEGDKMFDIKNVKKILSDKNTSYALMNNGDVYVVGNNKSGCLGLGLPPIDSSVAPKLLKMSINSDEFQFFKHAGERIIGLKKDGTLWGRGTNGYDQLGLGIESESFYSEFVQLPIDDVKDVTLSNSLTFVLKNDGTAWVCGYQYSGEAGCGSAGSIPNFTKLNVENVKQICMNSQNATFLVQNDGSVWSTGRNPNGQLGLGDKTNRTSFTKTNLTNVKVIRAGSQATFAIKNDGTVWACGANFSGNLGLGNQTSQARFVQVTTNVSDVKDIECGNYHTVMLKNDGTLWVCGLNMNYALGTGQATSTRVLTFTQVTNINDVKSISANGYGYNTFVVKNDNTLWACGSNSYGELGVGDIEPRQTFTKIADNIDIAECNYNSLIVKKTDGNFYACGNNSNKSLTIRYSNPIRQFTKVPNLSNVKDMGLDGNKGIAVTNDGKLFVCGDNFYGQLGLGHTNNCNVFTQITDNVEMAKIYSSILLVLKKDGTVWAAGGNREGYLGLGDKTDKTTLTQITSMTNVKSIHLSYNSLYITKNDNTLWTCGFNEDGQLGRGNTTDQTTFAQVLTDVKSIYTTGNFSTFVIKNDNTLWVCGGNSFGQLGLNHTNNQTVFAQVPNLTVKKINARSASTVVLTTDNKLYGAGYGKNGQFGLPDQINYSTFTLMPIENVKDVFTSYDETYVIKNDGTVWGAGENSKYQLCVGHNKPVFSFVQIPEVKMVTDLVVGLNGLVGQGPQIFAMAEDGIYVWGYNFGGELGVHPLQIGEVDIIKTPIKIKPYNKVTGDRLIIEGDMIEVKRNAMGSGHEIILTKDNVIYIKGFNKYGQLGTGDNVDILTYTELVLTDIKDIKEISCGKDHSVLINENGELFTCGLNEDGQLGLHDSENRNTFTKTDMNNVKHIKAIKGMTVVETNDGYYYITGADLYKAFVKYTGLRGV
jgi:alpha-tubulin suppressor-like RCC1 family protein